MHPRDLVELARIEDHEIARVAAVVVHDRKDPTLVLAGCRRRRDEYALAGVRAGPEGPGVHGAGPQVVLEQAAEVDALFVDAEMRGIPVTVPPSDDALVDPRELLGPVVEALLDDLPGVEVDGPPVQGRRQLGRPVDVRVEHLRMPRDIDHDAPILVVRVQRVEHVAELDVEPAHVGVPAVARHHTDPRAVVWLPCRRERALADEVEVEHHGKIEEDDVALGDREVVHHRRTPDVDVLAADELTGRVHGVETEPRRTEWVVPEEEHLSRDGVDLRVRGHRRPQLAAEVVASDGRQVGPHLRRKAHLDEGEDLAGVRDDVRVRRARAHREHVVGLARDRVLAKEVERLIGPHPPVPVRHGLAVAQLDGVEHPVAGEPVVRRRVGRDRVGPVAQVAAVDLGRDRALDRQVGDGELVLDGCEVPDQVLVLDGGHDDSSGS